MSSSITDTEKIVPVEISTSIKNTILDLILEQLMKGTECPNPVLNIYTAGGPDTGTLLASFALNNPPFSRANNGRAKIHDIPNTIAINSGDAREGVFFNKNFDIVMKCTVGSLADTNANLILYQGGVPEEDSAFVRAGYSIRLNTAYITINERILQHYTSYR